MSLKKIKLIIHIIFSSADNRVKQYVHCLVWLKGKKYRILGMILSRRLQKKYGIFLPYSAEFDSSLVLRHPIGIVIGEGVKLGKNVTIFQNVTLGRADTNIYAYPTVGDNSVIYSGAVVLGGITIGKNSIIGANAVVTKDVPDNSIAVGVPAKIVQR